jgi:hypothetical protein
LYQPLEHDLALPRGVLLEIEAGLEGMHGTPQRIVYRDFSLWPVGPPFNDSDEPFKKTQKQQLEHKWDQSLQ